MKKKFALLIMLVCTAAMTACGNSSSDGTGTEASKDVLIMATNAAFPPYEYHEGDKISGIDVDVAEAIAEEIGMTLEIEDMDFNSIITAIQSGKADIGVAGMTVTEERLKNVAFSESYATGVQVIIVPEDSDINSPDDLEGKMIGVQESTTGHIYCADDYGDENVTAYTTGANAIEALKTGKVDCVVIDNEPAKAFVEANDGIKILETEYVTEHYAIAIAKENEDLLNKVNSAMKKLKEDGTLQTIIDKYITAE